MHELLAALLLVVAKEAEMATTSPDLEDADVRPSTKSVFPLLEIAKAEQEKERGR